MTISISLRRRQFQLSRQEQALALTAASRNSIKEQFKAQLATHTATYSSAQIININPNVLRWAIRRHSEQLVYQPLEEMRFWFTYSSGIFLEPGYPPLYYNHGTSTQSMSPNKSAIASIGEGIAGFLAQRLFHARKLARPIHDYPDLVMACGQTIYLIEAKATTKSTADIKKKIDNELSRMSVLVSGCADLSPHSTIVGVLVGTALTGINSYETYLTEVRV